MVDGGVDTQKRLITRRRLLQSGGAVAAATLVDLHPLGKALAASTALGTPTYLRRSTYVPLAGDSFQINGENGSQTLKLLSISDLQRPGLAGAENAFSLQFSGAGQKAVGQGIHTLSHPSLGSVDLFIAAVERPSADQNYQLIVDRSIGAPADPPRAAQSTDAHPPTTPIFTSPGQPTTGREMVKHAGHPRPVHHRHPIHHASLERTGHGLRLTLTVSPEAQANQLSVWLMHEGRVLAAATHRAHGRRTSFMLHPTHHIRGGHYELAVKAITAHGPNSPMVRLDLQLP